MPCEGLFEFLPQLTESMGYSTNVLPGSHRRGSWEVATAPALAIASGWSRDSFGAFVSVQDTRYLGVPSQDTAGEFALAAHQTRPDPNFMRHHEAPEGYFAQAGR